MSHMVRKPPFCIYENKDADQLHLNRAADQRLCFRDIDCTIPLLPKSEITSLYPSSVVVQPVFSRHSSYHPNMTQLLLKRMSIITHPHIKYHHIYILTRTICDYAINENNYMSHFIRKLVFVFAYAKNKDTDQLRIHAGLSAPSIFDA